MSSTTPDNERFVSREEFRHLALGFAAAHFVTAISMAALLFLLITG